METGGCESCSQQDRTIDDCYDQVLKRLTARGRIKEVSGCFALYPELHEKVLYVYSVIKSLAFLPFVKTNPKKDEVAIYYRNQGNTYFSQQKYYEAWQVYNLSLLYADPNSEHFIYAVSNRSAVLFAMEKYEECLEDIKFVFNTQFPAKLRTKLIERKKKCVSLLEAAQANMKIDDLNDIMIEEALKLKGERDPIYLCASSKLKVVSTQEMGRHVIANEDIKVGEVIAEEEPYLALLLKSQFLFCCAYCLTRKMNLYPCMQCTYTLYCSVECREKAFRDYHVGECGLMPNLISMQFTKLEWLALRIMFKTRTAETTWGQMFRNVKKAEELMNTDRHGCVKVNGKWIFDSKYYDSVHTLATNCELRSMSDLFRKSVSAAVLLHFLCVLHFITSETDPLSVKATEYVADLLLRHIMTAPTNMHSITANIENEDGNFVEECNIACGAYPFHSLLNHSCTPNVVRFVKLGSTKMSLVAIRPIKKGMQIFDNYGYHHALHDRDSRRSQLKSQYKFDCACEACVDDWPLHAGMKEAQGISPELLRLKNKLLSPEVIQKLMKADKETAVNCYEPLCRLIEAFDPYAPCKELGECQEAMKQCLAIFQGVIPYYKEVKWNAFSHCASTGGPPHFGGFMSGPAL